MNYSNNSPRHHKDGNVCCQHLDDKGERCSNCAAIECYQFEDKETNGYGGWHTAYFCLEHAKLRGIK